MLLLLLLLLMGVDSRRVVIRGFDAVRWSLGRSRAAAAAGRGTDAVIVARRYSRCVFRHAVVAASGGAAAGTPRRVSR